MAATVQEAQAKSAADAEALRKAEEAVAATVQEAQAKSAAHAEALRKAEEAMAATVQEAQAKSAADAAALATMEARAAAAEAEKADEVRAREAAEMEAAEAREAAAVVMVVSHHLPPVNIMIIEGGGMGCFASGASLRALDNRLKGHGSSICECFSLIGATSAGGAQAIALITSDPDKAHDKMDALAEEIRTGVFGKMRGAAGFVIRNFTSSDNSMVSEAVVKDFLKVAQTTLHLPSKCTLKGSFPPVPRHRPHTFVTTTARTSDGYSTFLVRNYPDPSPSKSESAATAAASQISTLEALQATTAAPTYMGPMKKDGVNFYDGGIKANAPTIHALMEVRTQTCTYPESNHHAGEVKCL